MLIIVTNTRYQCLQFINFKTCDFPLSVWWLERKYFLAHKSKASDKSLFAGIYSVYSNTPESP